ncbi:FMN-linked oxidoreductase [Sodiomyces alkalinus F11]|uniref:Dihydroorotate dehydrogenase (fumarate) n=1 Tax=Sodiomyces alkalinus (strain CBS 110278 / VKM F-3762 / F11) TaxID=1314773 RepID=A0A3N2Q3B0_SODAK|nr:FMN-linked oxidoreductase [Sodiomyces alkalinus F11]ROT41206.1 FMN-linked oxidoreductase [Sodiomyces alkalinus F11]
MSSNTTSNPPPDLIISPPLLNSSNPWATTLEDLTKLYSCPHTGAVTTRTSLLNGFPHDDAKHQYAFFSPITSLPSHENRPGLSSLNSLGYSPLPLATYLSFIQSIHDALPAPPLSSSTPADSEPEPEPSTSDPDHAAPARGGKPVIVSVTGSPAQVAECYALLAAHQPRVPRIPLAMELNLSCPNIPSAPPPAYDPTSLAAYLSRLPEDPILPIGLKTPPYTHAPQFEALISALRADAHVHADNSTGQSGPGRRTRISFLTATNTLGSCLVFHAADSAQPQPQPQPPPEKVDGAGKEALPACCDGIGGMAGPSLHPLALGNVRVLSKMLASSPELRHVKIIGIGGVADADGYRRMRRVGAFAVGVGTALGLEGLDVFGKILDGLEERGDVMV